MPTSGAATVSESELSDSSHSDIDESIQHNTKHEKRTTGSVFSIRLREDCSQ